MLVTREYRRLLFWRSAKKCYGAQIWPQVNPYCYWGTSSTRDSPVDKYYSHCA